MHRDVAPAQKRINRIAETAVVERTFSPSVLPGLLQSPAYCRALFLSEPNLSPAAAEEAATERLLGQSTLETDREYGFLLPEGALGWSLLPPVDMAEQMDQLAAASLRPNVTFGVVPWGQPAAAIPINSFTVFDERLVIVGTTTRVAYLTVRTDLDAYLSLYHRIASFAVFDHDARAVLSRVADRYRNPSRRRV